jgi:hypothetical protein
MQQEDWPAWRQAEFTMLDQYHAVNMYGVPQPRSSLPRDTTILKSLWCYVLKADGRRKARNVCNGQPHHHPTKKKPITTAETYAASLSQVELRLFWAITARRNWIAYGADATNAFAYSPPPKGELVYMEVDDQYALWYNVRHPDTPIDTNFVLPVQHALQGHPESPRLWEGHINAKLHEMGFQNSAHAPCLYYGKYTGEEVIILRQVDDFSVASEHATTPKAIYEDINEYCALVAETDPVQRIYGIDILQSRHFIKISLATYLNTMVEDHTWLQNITTSDLPGAPLTEETLRSMESASPPQGEPMKAKLQKEQGFNYRSILGKLVFAMNCGRFDISFAISKLSQHNDNPAAIHYRALRDLAIYTIRSKERGLIYWRDKGRYDLDEHPINIQPIDPTERPFPTSGLDCDRLIVPLTGIHIRTEETHVLPMGPSCPHRHSTDHDIARLMIGFTDSDHANCTVSRRSHTGSAITLAGSLIDYNSRIQASVTLSSCEAELVALVDTSKRLRSIRNIILGLGIPMNTPTTVFCDNEGAKKVAEATGTTKRLRHVDMQYFAIQEWVKNNEITVRKVHTSINVADLMTKALSAKLHHRHMNRLMGYYGRPQHGAFIAPSTPLQALCKTQNTDLSANSLSNGQTMPTQFPTYADSTNNILPELPLSITPAVTALPAEPFCVQPPFEQEGMLTDRLGSYVDLI